MVERARLREPRRRGQIEETVLVSELMEALGRKYSCRRHMQSIPPGGRFQAFVSSSIIKYEAIPMISIIENADPDKGQGARKVLELYGPSYIYGSSQVAVEGIGELDTFDGSSLFVPPYELPRDVVDMLSHVTYLDPVRYKVINDGDDYRVERS